MDVTARALIVRRGDFVLDIAAFRSDAGGTAILGPNGAGKTTLLLALQGLIQYEGTIHRPSRTAAVFARPAVLRGPVLWNVSTVVESVLAVTKHESDTRARQLLYDVGIGDLLERDARTLSTGERQRLSIARALAVDPDALFFDEPLANIDVDGRLEIRSLVRSYVDRKHCALILVTSSLADAAALCTRVAILHDGTITRDGRLSAMGSIEDSFALALLAEARAGAAASET
jgi:ABC-type multidrug transport system ATPase subunit